MRLLIMATLTLLFISCSKSDSDPTPPVVTPTDVDTLVGWQFKKIDTLGRTLSDITFTDASTGFVCGEKNALFKTSDGGTTWQPVSISLGSDYSNIQFLNIQYGFMTSAGSSGQNGVLRTTNGGATWQFASTVEIGVDVFFINPAFGFCTTGTGGLRKSIDSGKTWSLVPATTSQNTSSLWFLNATKGFVTIQGNSANSIVATLDGGNSFSLAASNAPGLGYSPVYFSNTNNGCAGLGNSLYTTNDGGANWQKLKAFTKNVLDVKNSSPADYYVSTSNEVWHTTNSGNTWVREMKLAAGHEAVEFTLNQPGRTWISGANGRVYYK